MTSTPVLLTAVVLTAIFLTWAILATTPPIKIGVDLAVYQRAGDDLYSTGITKASNALSAQESQYRYPPLLAFVIPVLGWGPLWMLLMLTGTVIPFVLGWRQGGWRGRLLPLAVIGPSLHGAIVGNIQPLASGAWASVPFYRRFGPVILAFLFWVKVWPAISVLY